MISPRLWGYPLEKVQVIFDQFASSDFQVWLFPYIAIYHYVVIKVGALWTKIINP